MGTFIFTRDLEFEDGVKAKKGWVYDPRKHIYSGGERELLMWGFIEDKDEAEEREREYEEWRERRKILAGDLSKLYSEYTEQGNNKDSLSDFMNWLETTSY